MKDKFLQRRSVRGTQGLVKPHETSLSEEDSEPPPKTAMREAEESSEGARGADCVRIEEDFLKPMHSGGFYDEKVIIRRVKLGGTNITDFDGSSISTKELAERYDVSVTPTLVFIVAQGRQLNQKLVGLTTPELYGGYLDQAIDTSLDRLRRTKPLVAKISSN